MPDMALELTRGKFDTARNTDNRQDMKELRNEGDERDYKNDNNGLQAHYKQQMRAGKNSSTYAAT